MTAHPLAYPIALLTVALLTGAASPRHAIPLAMADPSLAPSPPAPQQSASAFTPAPMPDRDSSFQADEGPARIELMPSLFHEHEAILGDGYTPNSTVQGEQTKRLRPTPGLNLNVPLQ